MASPSSSSEACDPFPTAPQTLQVDYVTPGTKSAYEGLVTCPVSVALGGGLEVLLEGGEEVEVEVLVP